MAIDVTCAACKTRFQVSDKFAGKQGPCPKCKAIITVPSKKDEVVIHVPESGPKDSKGVLVLKPLTRKETRLTPVNIGIIVGSRAASAKTRVCGWPIPIGSFQGARSR